MSLPFTILLIHRQLLFRAITPWAALATASLSAVALTLYNPIVIY